MSVSSPEGRVMAERKIITVHEYPPIPIRDWDWVAYWEGDEEAGPRGNGRTEAEAIADLKDNYEDDLTAASIARDQYRNC